MPKAPQKGLLIVYIRLQGLRTCDGVSGNRKDQKEGRKT